MDWPLTSRAVVVLRDSGFSVDGAALVSSWELFHRLSSTWNLSAKLMSKSDLVERFDAHVADSLALLPYLVVGVPEAAPTLVDIGSGGGFPGIPLALCERGFQIWLVERSEVKCQFLRQAIRALDLPKVKVLNASFPDCDAPDGLRFYTARATENPKTVDEAIIRKLRPGDLYMAQREIDTGLVDGLVASRLHDEFTRAGLRRGELWRVCRS